MDTFFATGLAADLILAVLLVEAIWLVGTGRMSKSGALTAVLPGALLVLALRSALTGADWWLIALPLAAAFPAHLADLAMRRGGGAPRF